MKKSVHSSTRFETSPHCLGTTIILFLFLDTSAIAYFSDMLQKTTDFVFLLCSISSQEFRPFYHTISQFTAIFNNLKEVDSPNIGDWK